MVERAFDKPPPALARLAAQPGSARALRRLRADFDAATAPPVAELAAAAVHLIERIADGSVAANASATRLLGEAWAGLGELDEVHRVALVERLDACASGFGDEVPPEADDLPASSAPEPPILTIRADGTRVLPGTFDPAPATDPASAPVAETAPAVPPLADAASGQGPADIDELRAVATALEAACSQLASQIGALELLAGEDLQRLVRELSATSRALEQQKRALADWLAINATPTAGDDD